MDEQKIQQVADEIRNKSKAKVQANVEESVTRIKNTLERREGAIGQVEEYQKETGIPSEEEVNEHFIKREMGLDVDLNEFNSKENNPEA